MVAVPRCSWELFRWSWAAPGTFVGGPGPSWVEKWPWPERESDLASGSGPKCGPGPSGKAIISGLGCTWAALGAYAAALGPLLGLYWRSWAALGAAVCGLGPLLEPMLAVLGRSWGLSWRSWPLLGPPKAVLGRDHGEKRPKPRKVSQTRAGAGSQRGRDPEAAEAPGLGTYFFCRYEMTIKSHQPINKTVVE